MRIVRATPSRRRSAGTSSAGGRRGSQDSSHAAPGTSPAMPRSVSTASPVEIWNGSAVALRRSSGSDSLWAVRSPAAVIAANQTAHSPAPPSVGASSVWRIHTPVALAGSVSVA